MLAEPFFFFDWRISRAKYGRKIAEILGLLPLGASKNHREWWEEEIWDEPRNAVVHWRTSNIAGPSLGHSTGHL